MLNLTVVGIGVDRVETFTRSHLFWMGLCMSFPDLVQIALPYGNASSCEPSDHLSRLAILHSLPLLCLLRPIAVELVS